MAIYRPRAMTARIIFDDLKANGRSDRYTSMLRTGLTYGQWQYGVGYLKDVLQTQEGQPLIWIARDGTYDLTNNEGDWQEYLLVFRMRSIYTQLVRMEATAVAGGMKFGRHKKATKVAIAGITAARQMIEALV